MFRKEVRNCIFPIVPFNITIEEYNSKNIIVIDIRPGRQTPYILKKSNGRHMVYVMRELGYIESKGRGIEKIINPEEPCIRKPEFDNRYNFFMITLYSNFYIKGKPLAEEYLELLDQTDLQILNILKDSPSITKRVLAKNLEISKRTVTTRLNKLVDLNLLRKEGTSQKMQYLVLIDL